MTMVNAVVQRKTGYLYADTAALDAETGRVIGFTTKIFAGLTFPWAVGMTYTGSAMAAAYAVETLKVARNVAALRKTLPAAMSEFRSRSAAQDMLRLTIIAWDAREKRPRIFAIGDLGLDQGISPDNAVEFDWLFSSPADHRHLWAGGKPSDPKAFDPVSAGIAVMEARRAIPESITAGGTPYHIVGGEIEMAEITRQDVQLYAIHQWPDRVGERITA